ncbi:MULTISPECIES: uroporphyrinogen-III synthase [unclassified Agarivorans]|uniref:uroporphyrinogen-III synthase n=1 Tax=unclassified Agarivorans TaxID=2636026 RepID=UPI0026E3AFC6|nr:MULTISPECIES: uroporphyrinogen-III synthase [unclassified Agarivorans]MDO6685661.1 uroporphyrinogen-III synthase [Agarivorans sp. 3_MG-2023]MDO6716224.1 uroporphyrinogen-III synthase [Agarivorans sp. 2_MG-2023]
MQILVTRPQPHNQRCVTALEAKGFSVSAAPMLEIKPSDELTSLIPRLEQATSSTLIIAVSQYAVESCQHHLQQHGLTWPSHCQYLAVGKATAECWQQYGVNALVPSRQDSEGMLQLIESQLSGIQQAHILRGQHGREWLAEQLKRQQITVNYLTCYQRHLLNYSWQQLEQWRSQINTIVATSGEILKHLTTLMSKSQQLTWLKQTTLLVPSERLLEYAKSLGFMHIVLCDGASDKACIDALARIQSSARNENDQK